MKSILKKIAPFISVVFFALAIWFLNQEIGQYDLNEITGYISQLSALHIIESLILCGLSYLLLTGYDALGIEYIGEELSYNKIGKAGFIGYAFSHNIGMALVTGGSIRYRLYSAWGLTGLQVTKIVGFSAFTLWIGFCSMGGLSLLLYSPRLPQNLIPLVSLGVLGIILLIMVIVYLAASALLKEELSIWQWTLTFPNFDMAVKQVAIASLDWLLAASVLYVLLPRVGIPFFGFVGVFLLAQIIGLFSQVPGGLGVFESIMVLYLSNFITGSNVVGILLVYRLIYYLIPLILATLLLGYQEYTANRQVVKEFGDKTANWFPRVMPSVFSVLIFIGGAVLLFSGAMPSEVPRMQWLQPLIPLPVIEMSHFLASIIGAVLLILAHGIQRRIDATYHATIGVLIFGIIFSLLRGVSYIEASVLAVMLIALIPSRNEFHREASLFSESFSPVWITMILMVVIGSIGLGLFSYHNIRYQQDLWWQFTLLGDAPRYLRASVGVLGIAFLFGLYKLLRPGKRQLQPADEQDYQHALTIIRQAKKMQKNLLLLKDKNLLFSENRQAFIMYGVQDQSWIAMGNPVGDEDAIEELAWDFKDLTEENGAWPVFYQVDDAYIELYEDLGLTVLKLGEEARLSLRDFDLNSLNAEVQKNHQKLQAGGYTFDIIPAGNVVTYISELKEVSDAWLQVEGNHEKRFSLGYFREYYLVNFPVGVVRKDDEILAFSNLSSGSGREEIGHDLLRFRPEAPSGIIDFLLIEAIKWSRDEGYGWFNLGLAPISEVEDKKLKKQQVEYADQLYDYGQHLYNFEGLRRYKEKYHPEWEPVYLAAPAGLALATVLSNLSELISNSNKR